MAALIVSGNVNVHELIFVPKGIYVSMTKKLPKNSREISWFSPKRVDFLLVRKVRQIEVRSALLWFHDFFYNNLIRFFCKVSILMTYLKASGFSDLESKTNLSILNRVMASHKTSSNKSQNRSFSSTPSMTMCVKQVRKLSLEIKVRSRISLEQNVNTLMGATWDSNLSWKPTVLVTWNGRKEWILTHSCSFVSGW